jgi:prepilin-type N-terminal cleavage/methylation domain-containing protein
VDHGFTLVEVIIAMLIMMLAMTGLAFIITNAFAAVATSRTNQQAANLADAALAQDEALPWTTLSYGLNSSDGTFSGDAGAGHNMAVVVGGWCYEGAALVVGGTAAGSCVGSSTTWYNLAQLSTCQASLAPSGPAPTYLVHQECVKLNGQTFEIGTYPTVVASAGWPAKEVQVTAVVSWGSATVTNGGVNRVSSSLILSCGATDGLSASGC